MATLYKASGETLEVKPRNGRDFSLEELRSLIGCEWVEIAYLRDNTGGFFVVDEEGKLKGLPINFSATEIYSEFRGDYIVGDALLCAHGEVK